jgi:hypothetical protein
MLSSRLRAPDRAQVAEVVDLLESRFLAAVHTPQAARLSNLGAVVGMVHVTE